MENNFKMILVARKGEKTLGVSKNITYLLEYLESLGEQVPTYWQIDNRKRKGELSFEMNGLTFEFVPFLIRDTPTKGKKETINI